MEATEGHFNNAQDVKKVRKSPSSSPSPAWKTAVSGTFDERSIKLIGKGTFAEVFIATRKDGNGINALKVIPGTSSQARIHIEREISNGRDAVHENIVRLYDSVKAGDDFVLVLEYMPEGELFDVIELRGKLSDAQSKHIVRQVLTGLAYLHERGIAHRDVKPENILLSGEWPFYTAKLADLGLSRAFAHDQKMHTLCGSPEYCAPEVMDVPSGHLPDYDSAVDIWAIGVVAYVVLTGYLPFGDDNTVILFRRIREIDFTWPAVQVSFLAVAFVDHIFVTSSKRPAAKRALKHPWLSSRKEEPRVAAWERPRDEKKERRGKKKPPKKEKEIKKKTPKNEAPRETIPTGLQWKLQVLFGMKSKKR
jgi:serine/threonine protein kinase